MKVRFHPQAETELNDAAEWYESKQPGLGGQFGDEVRLALGRALAMPSAWQEVAPGIRRSLTHRFPYGVLYLWTADELHVLAVMNLRRHPDYWKDRA